MIEKIFLFLFLSNIIGVFILIGIADVYRPYPQEWYTQNSLEAVLGDIRNYFDNLGKPDQPLQDPTYIFGLLTATLSFIGKIAGGWYMGQLIGLLGNYVLLQYFYYTIYFVSMILFLLKISGRFNWDL